MSQVEILPWPLSAGHPTSESRVAEALRDSDLGDDWIVLHSLNLSDGSTRKKWCEADFVIIGPPGILVIEVKGGRIKSQNGSWYSIDRNNVTHRIQEPAEQAKAVAFGMARELANIHPELFHLLKGTTIGFCVSFPDVDWTVDAELLSLPKILIADRQKVRKNEIGTFVRNAMAYWVKKLSGRTAELTLEQRAMLRQALRPDFDLFQSLAATGERVMETQVRATEEQYRSLDMVQRSPRVCFEGGAGTGKSFVALEACRRLAREGKSVAMIVRSKPLATSFARELNGVSARVLTSDAIETHTGVYDALIVDEGQDLLQHATLDALNRIVRNGLEGGRWYWFMDVNRQLMPEISLDKECLERILRLGGHNGEAFILTNNCRNAPEVRDNAVLYTGFDIGTCSQLGGGGRVDILTAIDQSQALVKLADWLRTLRTDGFVNSDIALLTSGHPAWLLNVMKLTGYEKPFCLDDEVNRDVRSDPAVCCSSIAAFKGLERPCIAVVVPNDVDATVGTSELYVALTRARVVCAVIASPALMLRLETSAARVAEMNPEYFEGSPPVEARKKIVTYLHSELVGPTEGAESEIDSDPADRYCAGVLYPQGIVEANAARDSAGISDDALCDEETTAAQPEREEVAGDGALNTANEQRPSAMGISFVLKSEKSVGFTVTAHVARYLEESSKWFRTESTWTTTFESKLAGTHPEVFNKDGPRDNADIKLQARIRQVKDKELGKIAVITVTMINSNKAEKQGRPNTAKCCFESSFTVTPTDGTQLTRYVGERSLSYDDEEQELDLRYWNQRHYAIGHGTGASWKESKPGVCQSVSAVIFPEAIVRGLDFIVAGIPADTLSLQWLANDRVPTADLRTGLEALCTKYEEWIRTQRAHDVPKELIAAKKRIVTRQSVALRRMRRGVELLCDTGANPITLRSFRLANEAVLRQMIMSTDAYGGRSRPCDSNPAPELDPMDKQWAGRQWRPFQLAFILLAISSLAPETTDDQKDRDLVDLLWFPTGGGKTEAYLGLIAFESFRRRLVNPISGGGTVAIKRYTLRLLTTQQFTRASTLLCAMELMRRAAPDTFGTEAFRIGLWIGGSQSPNTFADARIVADKVRNENDPISKFFVTQCPYCGTASVPATKSNRDNDYGFCARGDSFSLFCTKDSCPFSKRNGNLPIDIVDESIYHHPPTLVIATIDKFARLPWDERSASMFGGTTHLPPSLIIQDELHLISGPLGTIAGVYEAAIDLLCSRNGIRPKIIAATATIRRAEEQCRALYGRDVDVFPPPGLSSEDSFFSREDVEDAGRMYVGLMPQGVKRQTAMVRTCAALWQAPKALQLKGTELDAYWTLVAYHNSRRELGKTMTAMRDDVVSRIEALVSDRNLRRTNRSPVLMELSSQAASSDPGGTAAIIDRIKISVNEEGVVDAVPCTNMISVGVDIPRLSLMLLYGQPKTAAEYIQASSRIGRVATRPPGLAVVLLSPNKPRDRSHYEMFCGFHDSLYRFVEPSSVTPYSPPALLRALPGMLVACIRLIAGLQDNADAFDFNNETEPCRSTITKLRERMRAAAGADADRALEELDRVVNTWMRFIRTNSSLQYRKTKRPSPALLVKYDATQGLIGRNGELVALNSMRNVDGETAVLVRP